MDIKQAANHLQLKGEHFGVHIVKNGVEQELYKNLAPTAVEPLLREILDTHKPDSLFIQERKKQGNASIKQGKYQVSLNGIVQIPSPVSTPPVQTLNNQQMNPSEQGIPTDLKAYMIKDLEGKLKEKTDDYKDLKKKYNDLRDQHYDFEREKQYLERERVMLEKEMASEKSSGLDGIMETMNSNPALGNVAAMAIGRLMGVDMSQMGAIEQGAAPSESAGTENDSEQARIGDHIKKWIMTVDIDNAKKFLELTMLVSQNAEDMDEIIAFLKGEDNGQEAA